MKLKAIIFAATILLPGHYVITGAFAEDADQTSTAPEKTVVAPPVAQPAPTKFYFEVDQGDIVAISQALSELPKRVADPLILKLQGQLQAQAQAQIMSNKDAAEKSKKGKK